MDCSDDQLDEQMDEPKKFCTFPPINRPINRMIKHPSFNKHSKKFFNDIGLLKLSKPVEFNRFVKPICLPLDQKLQNRDYTNKTFDVAGDDFEECRVDLIQSLI
jgi:hypothetical protein